MSSDDSSLPSPSPSPKLPFGKMTLDDLRTMITQGEKAKQVLKEMLR